MLSGCGFVPAASETLPGTQTGRYAFRSELNTVETMTCLMAPRLSGKADSLLRRHPAQQALLYHYSGGESRRFYLKISGSAFSLTLHY